MTQTSTMFESDSEKSQILFQRALTMPSFRVKMQANKHYTIAKKIGLLSLYLQGISSILMQDFIAKTRAIRCIVFTVWFIVF